MARKRILPPVYLLCYLLAGIGLHHILPIKQIISPPFNNAGIVMIFAGLAVVLWSARLFAAKKTAIKPFEVSSALVIEGPFRFSRNPMYLGMITLLSGVAVLLGSLSAWLTPLAMFITLQKIFIPAEEAMMETAFGKEYREYKRRVRRWL